MSTELHGYINSSNTKKALKYSDPFPNFSL